MLHKLVRAYIVRGCWHLLKNKNSKARSAFIKAKNLSDIKRPFNMINSDLHVVRSVRRTTGPLLNVLINYIDKEQVIKPDHKLAMTEMSMYIKLYNNLNRTLIEAEHSGAPSALLIYHFNLFNARMEKFKLFFDKKELKDFMSAFLLNGYLLIYKCQMRLGKVNNELMQDIACLYKEMADHYLQISLYSKEVKNNISNENKYKKLHQEMIRQENIAQCRFFQMQCRQYIDRGESTCLQSESLDNFINAVDSLAKTNQFLSTDYIIFINLCCRLGHQIKSLFSADGSQLDKSTCETLVLRLQTLVKIYNNIEARFSQHRQRLLKYQMPLSFMMRDKLFPLLHYYTANAIDKIQILSERINSAEHSDSSSPQGSDNDQVPSLELLCSLFPEASDILNFPAAQQIQQFACDKIDAHDISAWENFGVFRQKLVGDKRGALTQVSLRVSENNSESTASENFKKQRIV